LRGATCDLCSGSGLTANRKNLLNASELYPAFNWVSCSPRPALCYRPLLAFSRHFAVRERLCSSPGRRTNRKNLRNCQRTIMFLLLLKFASTKTAKFYPLYFQSSAARSQPGARIWCTMGARFSRTQACNARLMALNGTISTMFAPPMVIALCISRETSYGQGFRRISSHSAARTTTKYAHV
jgi:hypothetical protein